MPKKCVICSENIKEEFRKIRGSILRVIDENKRKNFIYVCSECQKKEGWVERAKVKGA